MNELVIAAILWLVTHLGVSSTSLRGAIVARTGEGPYLGLYSLLAAASLGLLIWAYLRAPTFTYMWMPNPDLYWFAKLLMPIACILLVGGFMVRNPTMVGAEGLLEDAPSELASGVTRITRHPFQWSVVLWGASHMIANGDTASLVFFSSFVLLSFAGGYLIDRKKAQAGDGWAAYAAVTSNLPFGAIFTGRNRVVLGELWLPTLVGLALYALMYWGHIYLAGVPIV